MVISDLITTLARQVAALPVGETATFLAVSSILVLLGVIAALQIATLAEKRRTEQAKAAADAAARDASAEAEAAEQDRVTRELAELKGRLAAMADMGSSRQTELTATLETRLGAVSAELAQQLRETRTDLDRHLDETRRSMTETLSDTSTRLTDSLATSAARTGDHLAQLAERLATIDMAQARISELSTRVVSLQDVLADKQARGAFGQVRMESIVQDGLPRSAYTFQATLSNGRRPDCLIRLPNSPAGLAVDAKFPLEGFEALRTAQNSDDRTRATRAVREAIGRHIDDIASKYLIAGETQDTALMFVPSEAIYAELHDNFADLIQRAHRTRIVIVSPNMLMLAIQTMQAILKDVQMREAAGRIQSEVGAMVEDLSRLEARIADLERHFALAGRALEKLGTSTEKVLRRGRRITSLDLDDPDSSSSAAPPEPTGETDELASALPPSRANG